MLFQTVFPTRDLRVGVCTSFVQKEQLDPQCIPMTSAIFVLEDVSIHPDILIWEFWVVFEHPPFFTRVYADIASAACPSQSGSRAITSITFAAVICDADEPCSVNTAQAPESSFTMSPRSTTLPLYFWNCGSNSEFLRWHKSINEAKWTLLLFFCASFMTSFLLLTCFTFHDGIASSFLHSLSTAAFASGIFIAWSIGINLCTKL